MHGPPPSLKPAAADYFLSVEFLMSVSRRRQFVWSDSKQSLKMMYCRLNGPMDFCGALSTTIRRASRSIIFESKQTSPRLISSELGHPHQNNQTFNSFYFSFLSCLSLLFAPMFFPYPVLRLSMASSTPFWLLRIMYWCMLGQFERMFSSVLPFGTVPNRSGGYCSVGCWNCKRRRGGWRLKQQKGRRKLKRGR